MDLQYGSLLVKHTLLKMPLILAMPIVIFDKFVDSNSVRFADKLDPLKEDFDANNQTTDSLEHIIFQGEYNLIPTNINVIINIFILSIIKQNYEKLMIYKEILSYKLRV
ncbi:MAG: hypothetical protein IPN97_07980 [Saprospiraceae bacterium]|nr:hypothetical protein [Saprospiraceae bacterium]